MSMESASGDSWNRQQKREVPCNSVWEMHDNPHLILHPFTSCYKSVKLSLTLGKIAYIMLKVPIDIIWRKCGCQQCRWPYGLKSTDTSLTYQTSCNKGPPFLFRSNESSKWPTSCLLEVPSSCKSSFSSKTWTSKWIVIKL